MTKLRNLPQCGELTGSGSYPRFPGLTDTESVPSECRLPMSFHSRKSRQTSLKSEKLVFISKHPFLSELANNFLLLILNNFTKNKVVIEWRFFI